MVTQLAFVVLVVAVGIQRLVELRISRAHEARLRARGGREHGSQQMKWMTLLHATWLVAMPLEVLGLARGFDARLALAALTVFFIGQGLRYAAMSALDERWCVKVITVPGENVRRHGVLRWIRHPNYLGVVLEIAALPLVHGAWLTALVATLFNTLLLWRRIRVEEAALSEDEDYDRAFTRSRAARSDAASSR